MTNYDNQTLVELETKLGAVQYRLDQAINEYFEPSKDLIDLFYHLSDRVNEVKTLIANKEGA